MDKKPIRMDISFLKPLAMWYSLIPVSDKKELPTRVSNALDSLVMIFGDKV